MRIEIPDALAEYVLKELEKSAAAEYYLAERAVRFEHNNAQYRMKRYKLAARAAEVFKKAIAERLDE